METATSTASDVDLMFLLNWASHSLSTELAAGLAELGVTPRIHCVLHASLSGTLTQSQVAEACGLDKTTMVVTTDKLEAEGLAERRPASSDRRAKIISVTDKGRELLARSQEIVDRIHRDVLDALPVELRYAFVAALTQLVDGRLSRFVPCQPSDR